MTRAHPMECIWKPAEISGSPRGAPARTAGEPDNSAPPNPSPKDDKQDPDYESSEGVAACLDALRSEAPAILVSGRAGTGKSRLINHISSMPGSGQTLVVAPTGIAALNIGAGTIHSTFRLPHAMIDAQNLPNRRMGREIRKITRLIIDEISMVRADMIDAMDMRLRAARKCDLPFGGVQVVMVGDFLQLPPVVRGDDAQALRGLGYETPFAFSSHVLRNLPLKVITLTKVWRQDDGEMIEKLGWIREGRRTQEALGWLNARCHRPAREGSVPMLLTPTRAAADRYNSEGIARLRKETGVDPVTLKGDATGSFRNLPNLPVAQNLTLIPGARVMSVKNGEGYVNGSLGEVVSIDTGDEENPRVSVLFDGADEPVTIESATWEHIRSEWSDGEGLTNNSIGTYEQIPLALGYAITIHKSQGLTLEDVRLDFGRGAFAPGQTYVALSRARSVEGLSFTRPLRVSDVRTDRILTEFLKWAASNDNLDITVARK